MPTVPSHSSEPRIYPGLQCRTASSAPPLTAYLLDLRPSMTLPLTRTTWTPCSCPWLPQQTLQIGKSTSSAQTPIFTLRLRMSRISPPSTLILTLILLSPPPRHPPPLFQMFLRTSPHQPRPPLLLPLQQQQSLPLPLPLPAPLRRHHRFQLPMYNNNRNGNDNNNNSPNTVSHCLHHRRLRMHHPPTILTTSATTPSQAFSMPTPSCTRRRTRSPLTTMSTTAMSTTTTTTSPNNQLNSTNMTNRSYSSTRRRNQTVKTHELPNKLKSDPQPCHSTTPSLRLARDPVYFCVVRLVPLPPRLCARTAERWLQVRAAKHGGTNAPPRNNGTECRSMLCRVSPLHRPHRRHLMMVNRTARTHKAVHIRNRLRRSRVQQVLYRKDRGQATRVNSHNNIPSFSSSKAISNSVMKELRQHNNRCTCSRNLRRLTRSDTGVVMGQCLQMGGLITHRRTTTNTTRPTQCQQAVLTVETPTCCQWFDVWSPALTHWTSTHGYVSVMRLFRSATRRVTRRYLQPRNRRR